MFDVNVLVPLAAVNAIVVIVADGDVNVSPLAIANVPDPDTLKVTVVPLTVNFPPLTPESSAMMNPSVLRRDVGRTPLNPDWALMKSVAMCSAANVPNGNVIVVFDESIRIPPPARGTNVIVMVPVPRDIPAESMIATAPSKFVDVLLRKP